MAHVFTFPCLRLSAYALMLTNLISEIKKNALLSEVCVNNIGYVDSTFTKYQIPPGNIVKETSQSQTLNID